MVELIPTPCCGSNTLLQPTYDLGVPHTGYCGYCNQYLIRGWQPPERNTSVTTAGLEHQEFALTNWEFACK